MPNWICGVQQDAHEFLMGVFANISDTDIGSIFNKHIQVCVEIQDV
jgi:hypothetical protein